MKNNKKKMYKKGGKHIYAIGGTAMNHKSPNEIVQNLQTMSQQAKAESMMGPVQDLKMAAGVLSSIGSSLTSQGMKGISPDAGGVTGFLKNNEGLIGDIQNLGYGASFANGGTAGNSQINAEGKEVIETPDGMVAEIMGPSHEQGGVDMNVPSGTDIYSKRVKGPDGKTMADRKKKRERTILKLEKLLKDSPNDKLLKKTLNKIKQNNEYIDSQDVNTMNLFRALDEAVAKYQTGGTVGATPGIVSEEKSFFGDLLGGLQGSGIGIGDAIGLFGRYKSGQQGLDIVNKQRAGDTPNINAFKDFGQDALKAIQESKGYIGGQRDAALRDIDDSRASQVRRNRASARSVGTQRALDLASSRLADKGMADVYNNYSEQMMNILNQQAGLENQQDLQVMRGEQGRDLADRQDRDNYYTQLSQALADQATAQQYLGRDMNQIKGRNTQMNLINQLSKYGLKLDNQGNIIKE